MDSKLTESRKSDQSEHYFERAKSMIPGGVHSPVRAFRGVGGTPVFMESAEGSKIRDVNGNSYVDFCMSWGPMILGHRHPVVEAEVLKAIRRGWTFGTAEPYSIALAELITKHCPWIEKIRFVNSGTEAVMSAIRLARGATGKHKIIKFDGCYHGHSDSLLVKAGSGLKEQSQPDSAGLTPGIFQDTIALPLGEIARVEEAFNQWGDSIAAVIIEPLPANNGLLIQETSFLKNLREITAKHSALLIFDEVISGFRVGFGGMTERTGIEPDLVTYGKIIGGGFPVGAYGGKRWILDHVAPLGPVYQAGTLSGNPVAMTAGLTTLSILKAENPYSALAAKTESLCSSLENIAIKHDYPLKIARQDSLFWFTFPKATAPKELYSRLFHGLLNRGIYLAPSAFEVGFLSTAHHVQDFDQFIRAFQEVIAT